MVINDLKKIYQDNKNKNPVFLRSLFKESLLYYVLDFITKSSWTESLIFKGGTCLRIFFDLPRLSEDLDFDIVNYEKFDSGSFFAELKNYFLKTLQFPSLNIKLANNKRTAYLKFPILRAIGLQISKSESNIIFVRLDLSPVKGKKYNIDTSIKSVSNFSFVIKHYSLADLFAGKIAAILTREIVQGNVRKARFKGRDYFDLIWFLEKGVKPNWDYLQELTGFSKADSLKKLEKKAEEVTVSFLESDLLPFFVDPGFGKTFAKNFKSLFQKYQKYL